MAASVLLLLLTIGAAWPSAAQEMPRVQVFGGYSYTRFDTPVIWFRQPVRPERVHFFARLQRDPGVRRGGGTERTIQDRAQTCAISRSDRSSFMLEGTCCSSRIFCSVRPARWCRWGARRKTRPGSSALGGGMDYSISPRFAVRAFQVDYVHTSLFNTTQNNLRFSTGLVYRWGTIKKTHRTLAPNP